MEQDMAVPQTCKPARNLSHRAVALSTVTQPPRAHLAIQSPSAVRCAAGRLAKATLAGSSGEQCRPPGPAE